jgi:hypothetical protein
MEILDTSDIFKGASLLCLGAELRKVKRNGRDVTFSLTGHDLQKADIRYRTGQLQVNPLQLKESLNLLRDFIFENNRDSREVHRDGRYQERDHGTHSRR